MAVWGLMLWRFRKAILRYYILEEYGWRKKTWCYKKQCYWVMPRLHGDGYPERICTATAGSPSIAGMISGQHCHWSGVVNVSASWKQWEVSGRSFRINRACGLWCPAGSIFTGSSGYTLIVQSHIWSAVQWLAWRSETDPVRSSSSFRRAFYAAMSLLGNNPYLIFSGGRFSTFFLRPVWPDQQQWMIQEV